MISIEKITFNEEDVASYVLGNQKFENRPLFYYWVPFSS